MADTDSCNEQLKYRGLAYPRWCAMCGLGGCFFDPNNKQKRDEMTMVYNAERNHYERLSQYKKDDYS